MPAIDTISIEYAVILALTALITASVALYLYFSQKRIARLLEKERTLKRRNEEVFAIASHNLRTPLTIVAGNLEVLEQSRGQLGPSLQTAVGRISRSIQQLRSLVEELATLSQLEGRQLPLRKKRFDLKGLLNEVVTDYVHVVGSEGLTLEAKMPSGKVWVEADKDKLRLVFQNLINNALQCTKRGGITIKLIREVKWAVINVCDTGIGIAPEETTRVFEKFYQTGDPSQHTGGMGIGLYIVKKVIEAHGGQVGVDSRLGKGSCFWFKLAIARA